MAEGLSCRVPSVVCIYRLVDWPLLSGADQERKTPEFIMNGDECSCDYGRAKVKSEIKGGEDGAM